MKKFAFICCCLTAMPAHAQSTGIPWENGRVLTAPMLQSLDSAKVNIQSLGQPGSAPKLNALGQITNPVIGDVSQAKATSDGQTVVQVTAKAANAVQKTDVGAASGVAPLDANKMMPAPVSGDVSHAPYATNWTLAKMASHRINLGEHGAAMDGSAADQSLIETAATDNQNNLAVIIPSGSWVGNNAFRLPDATHGTWYAEVEAGLKNWPYFVWTPNGEGMRIPYYGDNITSVSHDSWNSNGFIVSRVDSNHSSYGSNRPVSQFNLVVDTPNEAGTSWNSGIRNVDDNLIVTDKSIGYSNNHSIFTYDKSHQGYTSQTVGLFNKYFAEGSAGSWGWNRIDEMIDFTSLNLGSSDFHATGAHNAWRANAEEDMSGIGPDYPESAYDPMTHVRVQTWYGQNINFKGANWTSATEYPAHFIVVASDASGQLWMYDSGSAGGTSGSTTPVWAYDATTPVADGQITWMPLGKYHFDVGLVIGVGGFSENRIGTVLAESGSKIYNAVIDMSEAAFDPAVPYKVFGRLQKDMYMDLSADGTKAGQNNHLLGYDSNSAALTYKVGGVNFMSVNEDGSLTTLKGIRLAQRSKADILAQTNPVEGMTAYDTDDHAQVTYRCPTTTTCGWFPVQYGAALSN